VNGRTLGDDRIIREPGMQMPTRYSRFGEKAPQTGLMLAARIDHLNETVSAQDAFASSPGRPLAGRTKVTAYELGVNYWYSKCFRATFIYVRTKCFLNAYHVAPPPFLVPIG
jgi:hypothetical protein